ncbi:MAG: hypothetical protein K9L62_05360 [Vallitaleaceae bacterium]|nr:hypothetical protein [Vallitaleaceae bacterium]
MSRLLNIIFGWEEVLVTQDLNHYMKLKSDLDSKGIATRSEFVNSRHRGIGSIGNGTYYLYVKKEEKGNK